MKTGDRLKAKITYYRKIFSEIDSSEMAPLYLLKGEENFIMEEMVCKLVEKVVGEDLKSFNLNTEYGGEVDMENFISTANSFPFLSERRILVLRELEKIKGKWKQLLDYSRTPVPSTVVIYIFNTLDDAGRRIRPPRDYSALENAVRANGKIIQFDRLSDSDLELYVQRKAVKAGLKMKRGVAGALIYSVGNNLFNIQNELDKLSLIYEGKEIGKSELARVIGNYRLNAVYDLIDSTGVDMGNKPLELLSSIITTGAERPTVVVYLLIRHFLVLLKIKAGYKFGGYRYEKLTRKADHLGTRKIMIWLENLRVAEIMMKSVSFPEALLLDSVYVHSMKSRLIQGGLEKQ